MRVILILTLCSATLLAQQLDNRLREDLKKAVAEFDKDKVTNLSQQISQAGGSKAVEFLLAGYGYCANVLKQLYQEKQTLHQEMNRHTNWVIKDGMLYPNEDLRRYTEAQQKVQQVEQKIILLSDIKKIIVDALSSMKDDLAIQQMIKMLKSSSDWTIRSAIAEAFEKIDHKDGLAALLQQLKVEKEAMVKISILNTLKQKKVVTDEIKEILKVELSNDFWQVRSVVVDFIKTLRVMELIETLIDALAKNEGRIKNEINDTLCELTGEDKVADYDAWKIFYEAHKEKLLSKDFKSKPRDQKARGKTVAFFDIPVDTKSVIFLIDRSGSMVQEAKIKEVESNSNPDIKLKGKRKMDVAKYELKRVLAALEKGTRFNVIFFDHELAPFSQKLLELSDATKASAFKFIDGVEPRGGTNIYDSLEKAMQFVQDEKSGELKKESIDTIFLLSDGVPTAGQITQKEDILRKIKHMNKFRMITVNTIFVGAATPPAEQEKEEQEGREFMQKLAEQNSGTFKAR